MHSRCSICRTGARQNNRSASLPRSSEFANPDKFSRTIAWSIFSRCPPTSNRSQRRVGCFVEQTYSVKIFIMRTELVCLCLRIHAGWADRTYSFGNIFGSETSSEEHGNTNFRHDAAADAPIMDDTQRADFLIRRPTAIEQQEIRNVRITVRYSNTCLAIDRDASHDQAVW